MSNGNQTTSTAKSSAATTATSASSRNDGRNVDKILNDMSKSFSLLKTTRLFELYDPSCRKEKWSSLNWNFYSPTTDTTGSPSFWLASMDYLKTINLNSLRSLSSSSSAASSSSTDSGTVSASNGGNPSIYDIVVGVNPSQLLLENRIVSSVTKQIEAKVNDFMNNTLQAMFVGAVVGAAVATGVMIGMMAATGAIQAAVNSNYSMYMPVMYRRMARYWQSVMTRTFGIVVGDDGHDTRESSGNSQDHEEKEEKPKDAASINATSVSSNGPLVIVQGKPETAMVNVPQQSAEAIVEYQCMSCLESIAISLKRHRMSWKNVKRLTAYLVAGRCDASTFRRVLQRCTTAAARGDHSTPKTPPLVTILFVQQLEEENALMQVEAIATPSN